MLGCLEVHAQYKEQHATLPLVVVEGEGPSLFGRDWLAHFSLDWKEVHRLQGTSLQNVLLRHQAVFQPGLGTLQGYEAKIHVEANAKPKFCKTQPVPYALKVKIEEELKRLVKEGIREPVQFADWAAPIVPVLKGSSAQS